MWSIINCQEWDIEELLALIHTLEKIYLNAQIEDVVNGDAM